MTDRSLIVSRRLPGLFMVPTIAVSPSSTLRRVTTPSIGARIVVLVSRSSASRSAARACATPCSAAFISSRCTSTWVSASSSCCRLTKPVSRWESDVARSDCRSAWIRLARDWAWRARDSLTAACALETAASYCVGSIRSRSWFRFTESPSATQRRVTRPMMSAWTSILRCGRIQPLPVTVATRSRVETVSTRTSTPASRRADARAPTAPIAATATAAIPIFVRRLMAGPPRRDGAARRRPPRPARPGPRGTRRRPGGMPGPPATSGSRRRSGPRT